MSYTAFIVAVISSCVDCYIISVTFNCDTGLKRL